MTYFIVYYNYFNISNVCIKISFVFMNDIFFVAACVVTSTFFLIVYFLSARVSGQSIVTEVLCKVISRMSYFIAHITNVTLGSSMKIVFNFMNDICLVVTGAVSSILLSSTKYPVRR